MFLYRLRLKVARMGRVGFDLGLGSRRPDDGPRQRLLHGTPEEVFEWPRLVGEGFVEGQAVEVVVQKVQHLSVPMKCLIALG